MGSALRVWKWRSNFDSRVFEAIICFPARVCWGWKVWKTLYTVFTVCIRSYIIFARCSCTFERSEKYSYCYVWFDMTFCFRILRTSLLSRSFLPHANSATHISVELHSGFTNLCGGQRRGSLRPPDNFGLFCAWRWGCRISPKIFCRSVIFLQYIDETPNLKSYLCNEMIEREIATHRELI